jgi:cytochrome c peroxidase
VEEQAPGPIFGTVEMGMTDTLELLSRIASDPEYPPLFEKAFPEADTLINPWKISNRPSVLLNEPSIHQAGSTIT